MTVSAIESSPELGEIYDWPGNSRELEQCVRNVMVRGHYHPTQLPVSASPLQTRSLTAAAMTETPTNAALGQFLKQVRATSLTFDELLDHYCSLVFSRSEHLTSAAGRLGKHRATIQSRIQPDLVERFRAGK